MEDGAHHKAVWLACKLSTSIKENEAFVRVANVGTNESPSFYVPRALVRPVPVPAEELDGEVKVTLVYRKNGSSVVDVPGEPLSFGPRIQVPSQLLAEA
jgi:hypothetical protein